MQIKKSRKRRASKRKTRKSKTRKSKTRKIKSQKHISRKHISRIYKKYGGNDGDNGFKKVDELSSNEIKILKNYTINDDLLINKILRIEEPDYKDLYDTMNKQEIYDKYEKITEIIKKIKTIDNIMKSKAPIAKDALIVYRGTKNAKEDKPYLGINKGYISTTMSLKSLEKNSFRFLNENCCLYIYTIKEGVPYINLSEISYFGEENKENNNQEEILLPRGLNTDTNVSVGEQQINGKIYKTYNVTIGLNNQSEYHVEPIDESKIIIDMLKVFDLLENKFGETGGLISTFLDELLKKGEKGEKKTIILNTIDDFDGVFNETINDILSPGSSTTYLPYLIDDYKSYVNKLLEDLSKNLFVLNEPDILKDLENLKTKINTILDNIITDLNN